MTASFPFGLHGSSIIVFFTMSKDKNDLPKGWQNVLIVTVGSLLSVALFGLLCWGINCTDMKYSWHSRGLYQGLVWYVGLVWAVMTVFLLRKNFYAIPENNRYRLSAYTFFFFGITVGLTGAYEYAHHVTSSYHHCKSITRENIGDAEYIMSEQGIDVMDNCIGYDVQDEHAPKDFSVSYKAIAVAPVRDSHGVYLAFDVNSGTYETKWKTGGEMEDDYHDARRELREEIPNHRFDEDCHTYRRIFAYNRGNYSKYLNAVENSSQFLHDSLYNVESLPPIIEPIHDVGLGADARPNVLSLIWYLLIHFFICVALVMVNSKD